jgi:predicted membrane protein
MVVPEFYLLFNYTKKFEYILIVALFTLLLFFNFFILVSTVLAVIIIAIDIAAVSCLVYLVYKRKHNKEEDVRYTKLPKLNLMKYKIRYPP